MRRIEVEIPEQLYKALEAVAKRQSMTVDELASLWLWDAEYERRAARTDAGRNNGNISAGQDDRPT